MRRYINILISIAVISTAIGCNKSEVDNFTYAPGETIKYSPEVETTRATIAKSIGTPFNVATFLSNDGSHYYTDDVSYNGSAWTSSVTRYWPTDSPLDIFAYNPLNSGLTTLNNEGVRSSYSLTYNCPAAIDSQIDLLVKTLNNESPSDRMNPEAIDMEFLHALSGVKFNIKFENEVKIKLRTIKITYVGFERERDYNFFTESWGESKSIFYNSDVGDGSNTEIVSNETLSALGTNKYVEFNDIDNMLMVIPQPIVDDDATDTPQHISVRIKYSLISTQDNKETEVITGIVPLPAPNISDSRYIMGEIYTYKMVVNGDKISVGDVLIDGQNDPVPAYGNINLDLISSSLSYAEYKTAIESYIEDMKLNIAVSDPDTTKEGSHDYYATAERAFKLLADGVRDFVIVGGFGASTGDGKMGDYGSTTSPFYVAAESLGIMPDFTKVQDGITYNKVFETPDPKDLFSIDLRGVHDFPAFGTSHVMDDNQLDDNAQILTAGVFKDLPLLDEVIFPVGLLAIGDHAFQNCMSLKSVDLSEIIHIEEGAFVDCIGLTDVFNGKISRVHKYAFDDCENLKSIDLSLLTEVDESGFVNCKRLGAVNLSKLEKAEAHAFEYCGAMTLIDPNMTALVTAGYCAFQGCASIGEVEFGTETLTTIGDNGFSGCTELYFKDYPMLLNALNSIGSYAFQNCAKIGAIEFPKITTISNGAFEGCTNVEIFGDLTKLTSIGAYAFQNCDKISTVNFDALTSIGTQGFYHCGLLRFAGSNDLSKLTKIESSTFQGCVSIDNDDLNLDKVTIVEDLAFQGCTSLKGVSLDTAESIGKNAFDGCTALKELILPKATTLDVGFVSGCTSLETLILSKATNFDSGFIYGCTTLKKIQMDELATQSSTDAGDGIFTIVKNCATIEELIMPKVTGSFGGWNWYSSYATFTPDEEFSWIITPSDPITRALRIVDLSSIDTLVGGTFYYNESLEVLDLSSATSIGGSALQHCKNLRKLNLAGLDTYENGSYYAFAGNYPDCELWLSDTQFAKATGNSWQGSTWKAIYRASDSTSPKFTLE